MMRCEMKDKQFHLNYPIKRVVNDKICLFCGMVSGAFAFLGITIARWFWV